MRRVFLPTMLAALLAAGCTTTYSPAPVYDTSAYSGPVDVTGGTYVVAPGDTIYSIATRNGINPAELMRANGITDPTSVAVGTELKLTVSRAAPVTDLAREARSDEVSLTEPAQAQAAPAEEVVPPSKVKPLGATRLVWPCAKAELLRTFSDEGSKGIEVSGKMGDTVVAAAPGRVIFTGDNVSGYGNLVILSHDEPGLVTVYGHNADLLVKKGQRVDAGEAIARMGSSASKEVNLLFEVRYNDRPVNPVEYLP